MPRSLGDLSLRNKTRHLHTFLCDRAAPRFRHVLLVCLAMAYWQMIARRNHRGSNNGHSNTSIRSRSPTSSGSRSGGSPVSAVEAAAAAALGS